MLPALRLVGIVVFPIILFFGIDFGETWRILRDSQLALVLAGLAVMQIAVILRAWRWKLAAEAAGIRYAGFPEFLSLFYTGLFAGTAMPQLAASFAPVLFVSEGGQSWRRAAVSILFDRVAELAVTLLFVLLAALYLLSVLPTVALGIIAAFAAGSAASALMLLVLRYVLQRRIGATFPPLRRLHEFLEWLETDATQEVIGALRGVLAPVFATSTAIALLQFAVIVILAKALRIDAPVPLVVASWSLVTVAVAAPISIAGLGLREGVLVAMFAAAGEPKEEAVALGLLAFVVAMITRLPGALTWLRGASVLKAAPDPSTAGAIDAGVG